MNTEVKLTWAEAQYATFVGVQRRLRALANGRQHRYGYDGADNWTRHIEAAGSELALAKLLDRYWADSSAPDHAGDVGREQVRHTSRKDGRLIIHLEDANGSRFWLAIGELPTYRFVGWIVAADAKRAEWWTDPGTGRPAFFVPHDALNAPDAA